MKAEYDLSKMKSRRNPYASKLKKPVTMRLSEDVVAYFKGMAADAGVPFVNYGIAIAHMKGILKRSVKVFPDLEKILP